MEVCLVSPFQYIDIFCRPAIFTTRRQRVSGVYGDSRHTTRRGGAGASGWGILQNRHQDTRVLLRQPPCAAH